MGWIKKETEKKPQNNQSPLRFIAIYNKIIKSIDKSLYITYLSGHTILISLFDFFHFFRPVISHQTIIFCSPPPSISLSPSCFYRSGDIRISRCYHRLNHCNNKTIYTWLRQWDTYPKLSHPSGQQDCICFCILATIFFLKRSQKPQIANN